MPGLAPDQIAQVQARVDADPKVQAILQNVRSKGGVRGTLPVETMAGVTYIPHGYRIEARTGQVVPVTDFPKEQLIPWTALAGAGIGSLFAGGAAAGQAGGSAASMAGGEIPTIASTPIGGAATTIPSLPGVGGAAGAAASAGSGWAEKAMKLIGPGMATAAGVANQMPPNAPELEQLLEQQRRQYQATGPTREMVSKLAFDRLPMSAKQGQSVPSLEQALASLPPQQGGNFAQGDQVRGLLRDQMAQNAMNQPVQDAVMRLAQSRLPRRG